MLEEAIGLGIWDVVVVVVVEVVVLMTVCGVRLVNLSWLGLVQNRVDLELGLELTF